MDHAATWLPVSRDSPFGLGNLPFGAFTVDGKGPRVGVRLGDFAIDLEAIARVGLFDDDIPEAIDAFSAPTLNRLLARGRNEWSAARARMIELLSATNDELRAAGIAERVAVPLARVASLLPIEVGDYVDFYSSIEHATNLGKILRPDGEPLLPNYRWIPIGYHGRSGTVVVDGTPIVRPVGQRMRPGATAPEFGPTRMLDFELELGFITGNGPSMGSSIATPSAPQYIFGIVLLNDWSARDVQGWEYQPLGPFLSKSFATLISPWVVTLDALEPFLVQGPEQVPPPLPYLATLGAQNYDIELEVALSTPGMRKGGTSAASIARTNAGRMYWSIAQQLAHATSNGAVVRAGDLFGTGTISGPEPGTYGSMMELTWRGTQPLSLADGSQREFLEDGDTVTLRGWCGEGGGRIGLGEVSGTILPAVARGATLR